MRKMHRQLLSFVYGIGVTAIALWALNQGSQPTVIIGVVGMSMLTLMLIFGVEIDRVRVLDKVEIEFTDGGSQKPTESDTQPEQADGDS
jgi:hypothetical protein